MSTRLVIRKQFAKAKKSPKYSPGTVKRLVTRKDGVTQGYWVAVGQHVADRLRRGLKVWQIVISLKASRMVPSETPRQPKKLESIQDALKYAAKGHAELVPLTERLAAATGGRAEARETLKSEERINRKLVQEYNGDLGRVVDISGSRIIYKTMNKMYKGLAYILQLPELQGRVVRFKDRFVKPAFSGYRDILMNLKMGDGCIVELRLEIEAFNKAAKVEHNYYKEGEMLEMKLAVENRAPTPEETKRLDWLAQKSSDIYTEVWKDVIISNYKGVQDEER